LKERTYRILVTVLIVAGILALTWIVRDLVMRHHEGRPIFVPKEPLPLPLNFGESETARALAHPIKAGGVHSVTELLRLVNSDPAVAAHFRSQGFRVECARPMILAASVFARTSYRTDTGFAWTKTPILVLGGTELIVDCEGHIIKMNCANLLELVSKTAETPANNLTGALILPPDDLPFPAAVPPLSPESLPPGPQPPPPGPPSGYPPTYGYPCCLVPFGTPVGPPPIATPEPSLWAMLVVGWGGVLVVFRILRGPR
jgi:hypothetical protein